MSGAKSESIKDGKSIAKTKPPKRDCDESVSQILTKPRRNGRLDRVYKHKTVHFECGSLTQVELSEMGQMQIGQQQVDNSQQQQLDKKGMSSGGGAAMKPEEEEQAAQVELELKLLEGFEIYPPKKLQGIHRHFIIYGLMEYLKRSFNRHFSSEEVLQLVDQFYNVEMLKDDEEIEFLNHEEDFSLPPSYFANDE